MHLRFLHRKPAWLIILAAVILLGAAGLHLYNPFNTIGLSDRVKVAFTPGPRFPLTQEQKREDFLFLYDFLRDSYPAFDGKTELYGYDWLAQRDRFEAMVESSTDDASFYRAIRHIALAVQDGHVHVFSASAQERRSAL